MFYNIFQVFEEENCPNKNMYLWLCFRTKMKKVHQDIVKEPASFIDKTKNDIKGYHFNEFEKNRTLSFLRISFGENRQICRWFLPKIMFCGRYSHIFWKTCQHFCFQEWFFRKIGMDDYRVKHNLGYQQFAIINQLLLQDLNLDKKLCQILL